MKRFLWILSTAIVSFLSISCNIQLQNPFLAPALGGGFFNGNVIDPITYSPDVDFITFGTGLNNILTDSNRSFTISMWIMPMDSPSDFTSTPVISNQNGGNGLTLFESGGSTGYAYAETYSNGRSQSGYGGTAGSNTEGVWNHVLWIFDTDSWYTYRNGSQVDSVLERLGIGISTNPLLLGASFDSPFLESSHRSRNNIGVGFYGLMCNVAIFSSALDGATIQGIRDGTYTVTDHPSLVAYWPLDEVSGETISDLSGNGHNGTFGLTSAADTNDPDRTTVTGPYSSERSVIFFKDASSSTQTTEDNTVEDTIIPNSTFDVAVSTSIEMAIPHSLYGGIGYKHFEAIFYQAGGGELDYTGSLETDLTALPSASIAIDGSFADWTAIAPYITDAAGDENLAVAGADLTNLSMAQDSTNLYVRYELADSSPNPDNIYIFHMADSAGFGWGSPGFAVLHNGSEWVGTSSW